MAKKTKRITKPEKEASKNLVRKLNSLRFLGRGLFPVGISLSLLCMALVLSAFITPYFTTAEHKTQVLEPQNKYWFVLYRASNLEQLFRGEPGSFRNSTLIKTFKVKTGIPGQRPTPLPQLLGRGYWVITKKFETRDNHETAPYFLQFDVPGFEEPPFGPVPYTECNGQCNWELEGPFGMHGVNGDLSRLTPDNPGSSGCVRHTDEDITYLYELIDPEDNVRYYIQDI